jgi:hypothetical protein
MGRTQIGIRVFHNSVMSGIFGSKADEIIEGWRKLHNEELHNHTLHQVQLE